MGEGDHKSAIDLVMVNDTLYRSFKRMEVDEECNRSDISDHCWISTWWSLATQKRKQEGWIEKKYYSLTEEKLKVYREEMERKIQENTEIDMRKLNDMLIFHKLSTL